MPAFSERSRNQLPYRREVDPSVSDGKSKPGETTVCLPGLRRGRSRIDGRSPPAPRWACLQNVQDEHASTRRSSGTREAFA